MATIEIRGRVQQDGLPVALCLNYDPADPLSIALTGAGVYWVISRDLLIAGLEGPAGLGDVQIWPDGEWLHIRLEGNETGDWDDPAYAAVLELPYELVHSFVAGTELEVPPGTETVDVDAWLVGLLGGDRS